MRHFFSLLTLLFFVTACGPSPDPTSLITKARIIGSVYSVVDDETRTVAAPGETVQIELMITQKTGDFPQTSWAIVVCKAVPTSFGVGICEEGTEFIALDVELTPTAAQPVFEVTIPDNVDRDLLLLGAVCMGGPVDPNLENVREDVDPCADGAPEDAVGQIITGAIYVDANAAQSGNRRPEIASVTLNDETWEPSENVDESAPCEGGNLVQLSQRNEDPYVIRVSKVDGSREPRERLNRNGDVVVEPEDLPVAFYATELGLAGFYSVIDAEPGDDGNGATPVAKMDFYAEDLEGALPEGGTVVRFEIVMSDGRGGMDRQTRYGCVVP